MSPKGKFTIISLICALSLTEVGYEALKNTFLEQLDKTYYVLLQQAQRYV